nr:copper resistance CopC family protein [Microbacterium hydrocarbonoxydans]
MKTDARRLPATPIALAAALLTAFLVLVSPLSASAHDSLISSSPEAGSTVDTLPSELTLTFSAKLIDAEGATEVVVTDASGASVTDGPATVDGALVTQPLAAEAEAGTYTVMWRVVSSDGHPISEQFSFTVTSSTVVEPTAPENTPTAEATQPAQTAAPAPTASDAADADAEPAAPEDSSASTAWIWILAIAGIVILVVAVVIAFALKGRGSRSADPSPDASGRDSDAPAER